MLHTMTFRSSFPKTISLNYTRRSHYSLKEMARSSIETLHPSIRAFHIMISVIETFIIVLLE